MKIITQNELAQLTESVEEIIRYTATGESLFDDNFTNERTNFNIKSMKTLYCVLDILKGKVNLPVKSGIEQEVNTSSSNQGTKDFTRYIITYSNGEKSKGLAKRRLLTEVVKYLVCNNCLGSDTLDVLFQSELRKNSFNRVFAKKKGDILYSYELSELDSDYRRYYEIDFSEYKNVKTNAVIYVANNWEKESVERLIEYLNSKYKSFLKISKAS